MCCVRIVHPGIHPYEDVGNHDNRRKKSCQQHTVVESAVACNLFRDRPHIVVQQIVHAQLTVHPYGGKQVGRSPQRHQYAEQYGPIYDNANHHNHRNCSDVEHHSVSYFTVYGPCRLLAHRPENPFVQIMLHFHFFLKKAHTLFTHLNT